MYIIGELINGCIRISVRPYRQKDKSVIQKRALEQVWAGADAPGCQLRPGIQRPLNDIQWLINSIQEVTDMPLIPAGPR